MNDDYLMDTPVPTTGEDAQVQAAVDDAGEATEVYEAAVEAEQTSGTGDFAREREMRVAAEARYKSLQGQYDSFQRKQSEFDKTREETAALRESHALMQAQIADMSELVASKTVAEPDEPMFDETLKGFLGEQSAGFETALNRAAAKAVAVVRAESAKQIAALQAQLSDVQKKSQSVPFEVLRSSDSVYDEPGFAEFISAQKDPIFGVSIKEQMAQLHAQGKDVIPAIKKARDAYVAQRGTPTEQAAQVVTPRVGSAGSAAVKAPVAKTDTKSLQAEYEGYRQTNLEKDRPRRLKIMYLLAQNGAL